MLYHRYSLPAYAARIDVDSQVLEVLALDVAWDPDERGLFPWRRQWLHLERPEDQADFPILAAMGRAAPGRGGPCHFFADRLPLGEASVLLGYDACGLFCFRADRPGRHCLEEDWRCRPMTWV